MWEYPPMRTFIRNVGASIISIHQCMLGGPDAADTTGGMQTTKFVCDARLAPHLHRQLDVLKCDGSHPHDDTLQPKRGDGKCSADAATYPPELNRCIAVATTNAAAARHVASAALDFGSLAMSDAAVIKLSDGLAAARQITGATGLLSTCIASYINSASVIDRHEDVNLDSADYHNCPIDTPVAGGGLRLLTLCKRPTIVKGICAVTGQLIHASLPLIHAFAAVPGGCNIALPHAYESNIGDHDLFPFMAASAGDNPTYAEVRAGPEWHLWEPAIHKEIEGLRSAGTINETLVPEDSLPSWNNRTRRAREVVNTGIICTIKRDADGNIIKRKGRCAALDVKRMREIRRPDLPTFSPTTRHSTLKCQIASACIKEAKSGKPRRYFSFDVTQAYLKGDATEAELMYVRPPAGYRTYDENGTPLVWRLNTPLYGQGDAGRIW